jgi:hypothetical protein
MPDKTHFPAFDRDFNLTKHSGGIEELPANSRISNHPSKLKRYLARLLGALHGSRRLQAARVAREFRHLVQERCKW